jgi:hypothetical protein
MKITLRLSLGILLAAGIAVIPAAALTGAPGAAAAQTTAKRDASALQLPRPATDDPARRGAEAPVSGTVPGLTGAAAARAAGGAATAFRRVVRARERAKAATPTYLHEGWGINPPSSLTDGMLATQSVVPGLTTTGDDYLYAPTAMSPGYSCLELTTAYTPFGSVLWAWGWCGPDKPVKLVRMNAKFVSTYTTQFLGQEVYSMAEMKTSPSTNGWTIFLYNYRYHHWNTFTTESGTDQISEFPFGWDMFEVYSTLDPVTGNGYYCGDSAGDIFLSTGVELRRGTSWVRATPALAPLQSAPPPGSTFDCSKLQFSVLVPDSTWIAVNYEKNSLAPGIPAS